MNNQENIGKREIEKNRNINWKGIWTRVDVIAEEITRIIPTWNYRWSVGQHLYSLNREALGQLLSLAQGLFAQGQSCQDILEVIMPT